FPRDDRRPQRTPAAPTILADKHQRISATGAEASPGCWSPALKLGLVVHEGGSAATISVATAVITNACCSVVMPGGSRPAAKPSSSRNRAAIFLSVSC